MGYLLRESARHRWLRVYNLPQGKRYATSSRESGMVRARQNAVAGFIFGEQAEVVVWMASHAGAPRGTRWRRAPPRPEWSPGVVAALGEPEPEFFYKEALWSPGSVDREIAWASDGGGRLSLFSARTGEVFCPYDGGMDVILADAARVSGLRAAFSDWLSALPSGL